MKLLTPILVFMLSLSAFAAEPVALTEKNLEETAAFMKPELLASDANVKMWALKHHCSEVFDSLGSETSLVQTAKAVASKHATESAPTLYRVPLRVKVVGYDSQRQLLLIGPEPSSFQVQKAPISAVRKISLVYSKSAIQPTVRVGNTQSVANPSQKCMAHALNMRTTWPSSYSVALSRPLEITGIPMPASQADGLLGRLGLARTLSLLLEVRFTGLDIKPTAYGTSSEGIFIGEVESASAYEDAQLSRFIGKAR